MVKIHLNYSLIVIYLILIVSISPLSTTRLTFGQNGGINWLDICTKLQPALYQPCSSYVNPDNTLTQDGKGAIKCIKFGATLGVGATVLGIPPNWAISGLSILAGPTGCGNVVNTNVLKSISGLSDIVKFLP